jgi:hypothetical protein
MSLTNYENGVAMIKRLRTTAFECNVRFKKKKINYCIFQCIRHKNFFTFKICLKITVHLIQRRLPPLPVQVHSESATVG